MRGTLLFLALLGTCACSQEPRDEALLSNGVEAGVPAKSIEDQVEADADAAIADTHDALSEADAAIANADAAVTESKKAVVAGGGRVDDEPERVAGDPVPAFDVAGYCGKVSASVGGSYMIEKGCRDQEYGARAWAAARSTPARVRRYCGEVAGSVGGSYSIYKGCIEQELGAAAAL